MLWPFPFNHYPGTDYETFNWDWLLTIGKRMSVVLDEWENVLKTKVEAVLAEHPEWTTTVMNGAITDAKINSSSTMLYKSSYSPDNALTNGVYENTTYHYVTVPQNGDTLVYVGDAGDYDTTPIEYAHENNTTTTMITGITLHSGGNTIFPTVISDNTVLYSHTVTESLAPDENMVCYIGIPYDRSTINEYPIGSTPEDLLAGGDDIVVSAFFPLIKNGVLEDFSSEADTHVVNRRTPRCALGLLPNGTMIWITSDGYREGVPGYTGAELQALMQSLGCRWAYAFDGGGSTSLVYKGVHVNDYIDGDGTVERNYRWTLNTKAANVNAVVAGAYNNAGTARQTTIKELRPLINFAIELTRKLYQPRQGANLNDIETMIGYVENGTNTPPGVAASGWLVSLYRTWTSGFKFQLYIPYEAWTLDNGWFRTQNNGTWSAWKSIGPIEITNSLISMNAGYELSAGRVWQQGTHIYGDIVVHKTAGNFSNSTESVASLNVYPGGYAVNTGCWFSDSQWYNQNIGYLYYGSSLSVKPEVHDTYSYVKIHIDFVID